jgi:hypothetical protein
MVQRDKSKIATSGGTSLSATGFVGERSSLLVKPAGWCILMAKKQESDCLHFTTLRARHPARLLAVSANRIAAQNYKRRITRPVALMLLLFVFLPRGLSQDQSDPAFRVEFNGLTHRELTRRVFAGERQVIRQLAEMRPILETYLQSFSSGGQGSSPFDDAYFLSRIDFSRQLNNRFTKRHGLQIFLFGQDKSSQRVHTPGHHLKLYPDGYLDMLFVDIEDFDSDTYDLTYQDREAVGNSSCLVFSVAPRKAGASGRFSGRIWVETSAFQIVRIQGTFTPVARENQDSWFAGVGKYFHFDGYRQQVSPGVWLPAVVYFEEGETENNDPGEPHLRGRTLMWGYSSEPVLPLTPPTLLAQLGEDQLLAPAGPVEHRLNGMVQKIMRANHLNETQIGCRVLLTSPAEMFSLHHTVILSRGLLDLVPDESILTGLLAHQVAHILLGDSTDPPGGSANSRFELPKGESLAGLRAPSPALENAAADMTAKLLRNLEPEGLVNLTGFVSRLEAQSSLTPNLLRARFGTGLLEHAPIVPAAQGPDQRATNRVILEPVPFRDRYLIIIQDNHISEMPQGAWLNTAHANQEKSDNRPPAQDAVAPKRRGLRYRATWPDGQPWPH